MTQAILKSLSFDEFLAWYPESGRYELIDGEIVEVRPVGSHEKVTAFISRKLNVEIDRLNLPYFIPQSCLVKPAVPASGYLPDLIILDSRALDSELLWEKASTIQIGSSARLVVEVVSTNWRDDYLKKLADYEDLGIPEYWIVDYLALGGRRYIGSPKQPTISVYSLVEGEYQFNQFRRKETLASPTFPGLSLTIEQILSA